MSQVTKPMMLDETGKRIADALDLGNALLSAMAKGDVDANITDLGYIHDIVRKGLAPKLFNIGDQIIVPWKDVAADITYDVPLNVVHFGNVTLKDGSVVPGMYLQWHYCSPFGVQFDAKENEVATEGIFGSDYSYYTAYTNDKGETAYKLLVEGTDYTVGAAIPTNDTYYHTAIKDTTGNVVRYGYNRWSHSALRQYLNSKKGVNEWWEAQHLGDMPPEQLATKAGFMTGFGEDFLSIIQPVKVTTALNTVTEKDLGDREDTYDTFFLPSLEQMYAKNQLAGAEGEYFEYWKRATGLTTPAVWYEAGRNPGYIHYAINAKTSAQHVRLRSANRYYSCYAWNVNAAGGIGEDYAYLAYRFAPVCVIC